MTASEFAFLALGLVLGVAAGAALVEVARSRAPGRHEIRVTVSPNSIPARRSATLSDASRTDAASDPARGGPADQREETDESAGPPRPVPPMIGTDVPKRDDDEWLRRPSLVPAFATGPAPASSPQDSIGIAISSEPDPLMDALRARQAVAPQGGGAADASAARDPQGRAEARGRGIATLAPAAPTAAGAAEPAGSIGADASRGSGAGGGSTSSAGVDGQSEVTQASSDVCADQRRIADERCAVATRAREGAQVATETLRTAQRTYDEHVSRAESEAADADPRTVRTAKEAAQHAFREARMSAKTRDEVEAAARDWLTEINQINHRTREAGANAERHRAAAAGLALELERLSVEADAARISAESAEEACVAAREAVAACQEAAAMEAAGLRAAAPESAAGTTAPPPLPAWSDREFEEEPMASRAGEDASIIRLLRGDHEAMSRIVARLAGDDPDARQRWQTSIAGLLEALVGRAIEAAAFDFPTSHPFWGTFTRAQCRDVTAALASLGYRHDGFGDWADEHVPGQRDLSLAVGYAGLDPMRIRHWPSEAEMLELLREVTVAADEYVWEAAGGLTLGELVSLLGRRADALTELWNEWGTVRPLLLSPD
ncbi:MAG TPA: hypothetical protein VFO73_01320 [Candidatus Limnocylindrales bacterium]|nr:hypothetical protein [Candidatus Limnocylindrales bacterium]